MKRVQLITIASAALLLASQPALAEQWDAVGGKDINGEPYASLSIMQGEYALSMECNLDSEGVLTTLLMVPSLPNLFADDDVTADLTFQFSLPGGSTHSQTSNFYYYNGGPDDSAWIGKFSASRSELNAFGAGKSLEILNPDGDVVLTFSNKGAAEAVSLVKERCLLGVM